MLPRRYVPVGNNNVMSTASNVNMSAHSICTKTTGRPAKFTHAHGVHQVAFTRGHRNVVYLSQVPSSHSDNDCTGNSETKLTVYEATSM